MKIKKEGWSDQGQEESTHEISYIIMMRPGLAEQAYNDYLDLFSKITKFVLF
jgi:hypothetical protein